MKTRRLTFLTKGDISAADSLIAGSIMGTMTGTRIEDSTRSALALNQAILIQLPGTEDDVDNVQNLADAGEIFTVLGGKYIEKNINFWII